ncbi:MAG: 2,3-cyclic phosphate--5-hydroxyl ligase, partial [Bacteroidetes bacterium]|nr:2,3-cyclic phosphate--5-hydroxyl ligase [Bacteroidota bacterium]
MNKLNIKGEDLKKLGYPQSKAIGIAIQLIEQKFRNAKRKDVLAQMKQVLDAPADFMEDSVFGKLADELIEKPKMVDGRPEIPIKEKGDDYSIYGKENIEAGALNQMNTAMKLPVTVAGALMPDAHQGYGLPIGGVLATNNAVIPYGVGVDIGCRMCLSIYDIHEDYFNENQSKFKRELIAHTKFGAGNGWTGKDKADHAMLDKS